MQKINKSSKLLARLIKGKKRGCTNKHTRNEKGDLARNAPNFKKLIRYYKHVYAKRT